LGKFFLIVGGFTILLFTVSFFDDRIEVDITYLIMSIIFFVLCFVFFFLHSKVEY
jgi:hypothetical protein